MNKQELIEKLKDWQSTAKEDKQGAVYMSFQIAIKLAEQLDSGVEVKKGEKDE